MENMGDDLMVVTNGDLMGFTQPGYFPNSSPWFFDGPNRNRWFTVLNSMVDLSMAM